MSRRRFVRASLALVGLSVNSACGGFTPPRQQPAVRRIGHLRVSLADPRSEVFAAAFRQGLRELGYEEGQNLIIDERRAAGNDQLVEPASDLVRLNPEVILVPSSTVAVAARAVTATIPIVSAGSGDLMATGLAASHARPGGTVTGLTTPLLAGKQLEHFRDAVPTLSRVAVVLDATVPIVPDSLPATYQAAARQLGLHLLFVGVGDPADLEPLFETAASEQADGLLLLTGPVIGAGQARLADLAAQRRLPSMWQQSEAVGRGGLMAYGPNTADLYRRAASYVDRILKGAWPGDLPIQEPTTYDFSINLRTARAMGLTLPDSVLQQATEIIP